MSQANALRFRVLGTILLTDADRLLVQRRELVSTGSAPNQQVVIVLDFNTGEIISTEAECRG